MTELLPCPFCGGEANELLSWLDDQWPRIYCKRCGATADSVEEWNTRAERTTPMYRDNHGIWHCENCEHGADRLTGSDGALDAWADSWAPNYCPNCGAKVVDE